MPYPSLRAKSLAALALACLVTLLLAGALGWQALQQVRAHFGQAYADNLTLLNRERILAPVALDLALSLRLAGSEVTRSWLLEEADAARRELFFREAEGYRGALRDRAYFVASAASGNYYFSDGDGAPIDEPRYVLATDAPEDAWFYASLAGAAPYNINVSVNPALGMTRVWINAQVLEHGQPIGMTGASIDLTGFLDAFIGSGEVGVTPMILNRAGAIQAHPDRTLIAYDSGVDLAADDTVFRLLRPAEAEALRAAMQRAQEEPGSVQRLEATLAGTQQLVSLSYLPQLDWYAVTAVDLAAARVFGTGWLWPAVAAGLALLALLLASFGYAVERMVLRPVRRLRESALAVAGGDYATALPPVTRDEIGDLTRAFADMAAKVRAHTEELEERVRQRTTELEAANHAMQLAQKKIGDSIDYASLIQRAILPERQMLRALGDACVVLWRPRDVVGGDFYVFREDGENCLIGVMDCAGHGVPGALMTMLVRAAFDVAVQDGACDPAAILARIDAGMRTMLADAQMPRGLATNTDAGLVYVDRAHGRLRFAGARIALHASDGERIEAYPGGRRALGDKRPGPYENVELPLLAGWTYCMATDGFLDQAGGADGYGFGDARFAAMLRAHAARPLAEQAEAFARALADYQGDHPQRDDITLLSFRFGSRQS